MFSCRNFCLIADLINHEVVRLQTELDDGRMENGKCGCGAGCGLRGASCGVTGAGQRGAQGGMEMQSVENSECGRWRMRNIRSIKNEESRKKA